MTAVRVNDHIDFTLIHCNRDFSYNLGVDAKLAKHFFKLCGRLARRGKITRVNLKPYRNIIVSHNFSPFVISRCEVLRHKAFRTPYKAVNP